jgi:gamma-butyrobetaine dioxygenase
MRSNAVSLTDHGLTVEIDATPRYFNAWWLRSACPTAIDPVTRERVLDLTTLAEPPRIAAAWIEGDALAVDWATEPLVSHLPLAGLAEVAAAGRRADPADLPRRLWRADDGPAFTRIAQGEIDADDAARLRLARALIEDGVAVVTDMENSEAGLARLVAGLGPVTNSAEGDAFEVRVEVAPTNLAFTAGALEMHTDLPGEEMAPGVQFLHCRANTVEGGLSLFADGAAVAEALRAEDPEAFDLLAAHDIPFFYRHDGWDYRAHQRVIERDVHGAVSGVTVSQHLMDDLDLPQPVLDRYFPALRRFLGMLQEPRFVRRFRLNAGECIVFDNHRIVHGREAYCAESGERHLRGCYTDRGAVRSTYRILAARAAQRESAPAPVSDVA